MTGVMIGMVVLALTVLALVAAGAGLSNEVKRLDRRLAASEVRRKAAEYAPED